ncbi:translational GTPase TypA [Saprospiraceae bacterium]|jgi:GTP-binding protein|nr:translational GTPase TypA [bacterium]MDC3219564.1 translational GTPase TypA [Saprospiraceae bacterium]MDG1434188.1 translational GTPase TypA [Saprospiraceae bacterium]
MKDIRNIAIIAHVDHGKTTLVDKILYQCNLFRDTEEKKELILDNNDLERERGITIVSKNVSVVYKDVKINIIDTPGHADFGGEVERVLNMADGVLLIVDAFEGPMPQTRYVMSKAIELGLKPIVVVNKVDKENCRPEEVQDDVFDLMANLDASEDQLDFATVYGSAKNGWMGEDYATQTEDVTYLLDQVLEHIPSPKVEEGTLQMQITSIDYSNYIGRIGVGRVNRGTIKSNSPISLVKRDGSIVKGRIKELYSFTGMGKEKVEVLNAGDICAISGIDGFDIGDTIADFETPEGMTPISIDEPTMSMYFTINTSPFFGKEGDYVTSRHLRDRLFKETEKNLALKVEETTSPDSYNVYGRGVLHLSVLIETMRREGYELAVGKPQVIIKEIDGVKCEPVELLSIDVPEEVSGKVIEAVSNRKGEMTIMEPKGDLMHLEFEMPSRGIIGIRNQILTLTAGEAIMSHRFIKYDAWKGDLPSRNKGVLIAHETGTTIPFAMFKLQDRGKFFVPPGVDVYEGQIVGENTRDNDLVVNVIRTKKLSNMRSSGADDKVKIAPHTQFSLEQYMEYIGDDEYLELTPKSMRLRKIFLKEHERKRAANPNLVM